MRLRRAAPLVLACSLLAAACAGGGDTTTASSAPHPKGPLTTIHAGALTVGTELPAPTFWDSADYRSVRGGFEYDIAAELARRLGRLRVDVVKCPFIAIVAGAPCACDIDFSQITITPDRRRHWDFTIPYFDADYAVMVKTSSTVHDVTGARNLRFGEQAETTPLTFLEQDVRPTRDPKLYDTTKEMFDAFNTGEVDAILFDLPILLSAIKEAQVADAKIVGQFRTGEQYGAVLPKGSPNTGVVNTTMQKMQRDGTLEHLEEKYFGVATRNAAPLWTA
jgi:polar amino acid transport system substrate-binding protein